MKLNCIFNNNEQSSQHNVISILQTTNVTWAQKSTRRLTINELINTANNTGDRTPPWRTPAHTWNWLDKVLPKRTIPKHFEYQHSKISVKQRGIFKSHEFHTQTKVRRLIKCLGNIQSTQNSSWTTKTNMLWRRVVAASVCWSCPRFCSFLLVFCHRQY